MKVVICKGQTMGPVSGADETLVTYATNLHRAGVSVSVLLMFSRRDDSYYARLREAGVPVQGVAHDVAATGLRAGRSVAKALLAVPPLRRMVRRGSRSVSGGVASRYYPRCREVLGGHRPDVIHVLTPDPSSMVFIKVAHELGIPVLYHELGIPFHPPGYESYYEHFTSVLPLCSEVAALSPVLAGLCREVVPAGRPVSVLPVMVDSAPPAPKTDGRGVVFGFAARVETIKGISELVEAFGVARRSAEGIRLYVAGSGSKIDEMIDRAATLGVGPDFQHFGVYEGPAGRSEFLHKIDVLVLPSHTEGTPNSIAEAMSQGIPVIASAVGGIPDMLGGGAGLLVPVGDPGALADAMLRLAGDPDLRSRVGRAARERYEHVFSPRVVLPLLLQTYSKLSAGGGECDHPAATT